MEVVITDVVCINARKAQDLWTANPVVHGSGLIDPRMVAGREFCGFWQVRSGQGLQEYVFLRVYEHLGGPFFCIINHGSGQQFGGVDQENGLVVL